jgi:pimeloyl-ACP methyl ester carboxylesterase
LFLSEEIAKAIPAAALVVVDQCGHLVTMEKPEEANLILKTWLDR